MYRDYKLWLTLGGVVFGGWLIVSAVGGNRDAPVRPEELGDMVFVCRESQAVFVGRVRSTPATHPTTGKDTLLPGWYCPKCAAWHSGPPSDLASRTPGKVVCPKTRVPLLRDGPRPDTAQKI